MFESTGYGEVSLIGITSTCIFGTFLSIIEQNLSQTTLWMCRCLGNTDDILVQKVTEQTSKSYRFPGMGHDDQEFKSAATSLTVTG